MRNRVMLDINDEHHTSSQCISAILCRQTD